MDISKIDNVEILEAKHLIDYCILSADYDGRPMTDLELDTLADNEEAYLEVIYNTIRP